MHGLGDVRFFDRLAPIYDVVMPTADASALESGLARAERPINQVVDLGGGSGRATIAVEASSRTVLDISRPMLRSARSRHPEQVGRQLPQSSDSETVGPLNAVQGDAGLLPIATNAVDAAITVDAFHHMPNQRAVVDEAARIIRPGGVFVLREFDPTHPLGWLLVRAEGAIGMRSRFYTPSELADLLAEAGFKPFLDAVGLEYTLVGTVPPEASTDE